MLKDFRSVVDVVAVAAVFTVIGAGCSSSTAGGGTAAGCPAVAKEAGCPAKEAGCPATSKEAGCPATDAGGTPQTPPTGAANVEAWIKTGAYKQWACETAIHASRNPSPHGFNRICSNEAIATTAAGNANWPKGAAAVKELYASPTDTTPSGYAVYLKEQAESAGGANWYWYERQGTSVVADGPGGSGPPNTICVDCHTGAGSNAAHTPSAGARDYVYTPVRH